MHAQNNPHPPIRLLTLTRTLPADLDTPVSVYLRLAGHGPSFMLESVSGGERLARYSFIGVHPRRAFVLHGRSLQIYQGTSAPVLVEIPETMSPVDALRTELKRYALDPHPELPRFAGGLVGYFSYETMRFFENSLPLKPHPSLPDAILLQADTLVAFDHAFGNLVLIASVPVETSEEAARAEAQTRLDEIEALIRTPLQLGGAPAYTQSTPEPLRSNISREQFVKAVETAREHIAAGDIFQVVLSQRLEQETDASPFSIYRSLRRLNPSPYMFYFDFQHLAGPEPLHLIGASPEMHVRLENGIAAIRPIAGTRPRGKTPSEDQALEKELLADPKERAEHVMLIDLARNDLGRVCEYGTVRVPEQFIVERYSHVMHIVSHAEGRLRPEFDAFDLLAATFPAGTVSGAPKIRAMQIINALEPDPRGPYAGAVGYFSYDGSLDTCIALRTLVMRGRTVSIQAGAGIVADSEPEKEYQETLNKARALAVAVQMAGGH